MYVRIYIYMHVRYSPEIRRISPQGNPLYELIREKKQNKGEIIKGGKNKGEIIKGGKEKIQTRKTSP